MLSTECVHTYLRYLRSSAESRLDVQRAISEAAVPVICPVSRSKHKVAVARAHAISKFSINTSHPFIRMSTTACRQTHAHANERKGGQFDACRGECRMQAQTVAQLWSRSITPPLGSTGATNPFFPCLRGHLTLPTYLTFRDGHSALGHNKGRERAVIFLAAFLRDETFWHFAHFF